MLVVPSCLTLWDPMDCSPPGFSVQGILQGRILEWVAIPFSRGSSWPRDQTRVSCFADGFFTFWATREALFLIFHLIAPASFQCFKTLLQNSHWNWKLPNYHYKGTKSLVERRRQGARTIAYVNYLRASEKTALSTFGLLFSNIKWEL